MAIYFWDNKILIRSGEIALAEACCCVEDCCANLPETTYAVFENLGDCTGRTGTVTLTKTTDMSGTYWYGVFNGECEPDLEMKFYCRVGNLSPGEPIRNSFGVDFSTEAPYALPGCENAGGPQMSGGFGFPSDPANPGFDCLPIYWTWTQCEDLWDDSCCEEGGSFKITWQATAP